jgi:hypothetical protein
MVEFVVCGHISLVASSAIGGRDNGPHVRKHLNQQAG